jgi:hypothetical protein
MGHWNGTTLTFDDGAFTLDGNTAAGLLAITPGARPRIEGTLDFEQLALDPYIGTGTPAEPVAAQVALADQAILKYFDADLRISAAEILAPPVTFGRGGFTIGAKGGVVATEVGELELCGGQASGRIGLDFTQEVAKATLSASLFDLPVDGCLKSLYIDVPVSGLGALKAELETEGSTYDELVRGLGGSFKISARSGAVPIDFARLLTAAAPPGADGWSHNSVTVFDQLKADCRLAGGHIWCDLFNMETRRRLISGSGNIDLGQQTLDWSLFVASHAQPLKASQLSPETAPRISVSGALAQPMIRRADRPTIGDGSARADPAANQISPR